MNNSRAFLFLLTLTFLFTACSTKPSKISNESSAQHYQDPEYNRVFNTEIMGALPEEANIEEVKVFPKEEATYVLIDYSIESTVKRDAFVQKWNTEKQAFIVVKIDCKGKCGSSSSGCKEEFNKKDNTIYCACQDDACAMETTFL